MGGAEWSAAAAARAAGPAWERETGRRRETPTRAVNRAAGSEPERERTGRPPRGPRAPPERSCGREEDAAMGLLSQGSPLSWEETQRHADHVRRHGILQFLHIYHAVKDRHKDVLKWGDEVEYMLVSFDHENRKVQLLLNGGDVLETLQEKGERTKPQPSDPLETRVWELHDRRNAWPALRRNDV